jgi:hypothetical protein
MELNQHIPKLILDALSDIENDSVPLSSIIRKCIRAARLRNDFYNLIWLEWEMIELTDKELKYSVLADLLPHLTSDFFEKLNKKFGEAWLKERTFENINLKPRVETEEKILPKGIGEIETFALYYENAANDVETPPGLHPLDLYFKSSENANTKFMFRHYAKECKAIIERVRHRVYEFLSLAEKEILFGQIYADIFEQNRLYVDVRLGQICPDALNKFVSAYKRMKDDDLESWAQALTSCRRMLKSVADTFSPPRDGLAIGSDGKEHKLTDENYIARLWQFVFEKLSSSRSGELLQTQINEIGNRLNRLYNLTNKGVHAEVSRFEVNQVIIQTYLIVGDILKVADDITAIKED